MNNLEVLYEDNHIIVVVKPCNVLSQGDKTGDKDMLTIIKEYLKEKYQKPGNVFVGLVHRLDRPVSGVMVFAKTSKAASRLSEQVRNKDLKKRYLAVIHGIMEQDGEMVDYLRKNMNYTTEVVSEELGKYAKLDYTVVDVNKELDLSLVDILLETGRHHQIRVQFASRGYPLYGDNRYGKQSLEQIALHAYSLTFTHPVTKEEMTFVKYPPETGVWKNFNMKKRIEL